MRIVFSKNRAAQLDLLLRSIRKHMTEEKTVVLWAASTPFYAEGYNHVSGARMVAQQNFNKDFRNLVAGCEDETITLFCDDDIVYRDVPVPPSQKLLDDERVFSVCLYLGTETTNMVVPVGFPIWEWQSLAFNNFGFPTAIDGNTYRVNDLLMLIGNDDFSDARTFGPTWLETKMSKRAKELGLQRPLMTAFHEQSLVGVPVNRVSDQSGVGCGYVFPQPADSLNESFLANQRICLEALDFSGIRSCHHEILFKWEPR